MPLPISLDTSTKPELASFGNKSGSLRKNKMAETTSEHMQNTQHITIIIRIHFFASESEESSDLLCLKNSVAAP